MFSQFAEEGTLERVVLPSFDPLQAADFPFSSPPLPAALLLHIPTDTLLPALTASVKLSNA